MKKKISLIVALFLLIVIFVSIPKHKNISRLPKDIDGAVLVVTGIRKIVNPNFKDLTADELFKKYSINTNNLEIGNLIFFDYNNDGTMDYVATNIKKGVMIYASSSLSTVEEKPINYLNDEVLNQGGKIYYMQLDWDKIKNQ